MTQVLRLIGPNLLVWTKVLVRQMDHLPRTVVSPVASPVLGRNLNLLMKSQVIELCNLHDNPHEVV